jgi:hypothetical protein
MAVLDYDQESPRVPGLALLLVSFSMTTQETTTLFGFTEQMIQSDLSDVTAFSFDVPSNAISMTVQLSDDPNESPLFANFRVIPDFANSGETVGVIGLAVGSFSISSTPEPASYALMGLGILGGVFLMRRRNKHSEQ